MSGSDCAAAAPPMPTRAIAANAADRIFICSCSGDRGAVMICSASNDTCSDLRTVGRAPRFQCVRKQFDPVLSPKHFAVEHIDRRTEHVGGQRVLTVLLIGRTDRVRAGALNQLVAGQSSLISNS